VNTTVGFQTLEFLTKEVKLKGKERDIFLQVTFKKEQKI